MRNGAERGVQSECGKHIIKIRFEFISRRAIRSSARYE